MKLGVRMKGGEPGTGKVWAVHVCDTCGLEFEAYPNLPVTGLDFCHVYPCPSYDPEIDVLDPEDVTEEALLVGEGWGGLDPFGPPP